MGKADKGDGPKEDYEFVPPDFDEDAFIHKEMVSFKTTSTLIMVGILAAVISWLVFAPVGGEDIGWFVGLAILAIAFAALKPLYRALHFDISHYGRREWIGTGFLLFFTWLAFFMIFLNPPFSDHAEPTVAMHANPIVGEAGKPLRLDVFVADNDAVQDVHIQVFDEGGAMVAERSDFQDRGHGHYQWTAMLGPGEYTLHVDGHDPAGHVASRNTTFRVVEDALAFTPKDLPTRQEELFVPQPDGLPRDNTWAVYADFDHDPDTTQGRVYFEYAESRGGWFATSNFAGWQAGTNNFTVFMEQRNQFEGQTFIKGGVLSDGPHQIEVGDPGNYDKNRPGRPNPTDAPMRNVPGLEASLLVGLLIGVGWIVRRRR